MGVGLAIGAGLLFGGLSFASSMMQANAAAEAADKQARIAREQAEAARQQAQAMQQQADATRQQADKQSQEAQQQLAETQRYNKEMESAQSQQEAEAAYVRDTERRRLVQRQGISGTILTSGLGGLSDTGSRTLTSGVKLGGGGLNG